LYDILDVFRLQFMTKPTNLNLNSAVCPFLGLKDDSTTSFTYPELANHCFRCDIPAIPVLEHQSAFCLTKTYTACPVFNQADGGAFPPDIRFDIRVRPSFQKRIGYFSAFVIGILLIVLAFWFAVPSFSAGQLPTRNAPASSMMAISLTPSPKVSATRQRPRITPTLIPTKKKPSLTSTKSPPQPHKLEATIMVGPQPLLMHRVAAGEQTVLLVKKYQTNVEVLQSINHEFTLPLFARKVIVIAPGLQTVDPNLPTFKPYQITDNEIDIESLAKKLGVDPALLKYYNNCKNNCKLKKWNWLLIPYQKTPTPLPPSPTSSATPTEISTHRLETSVLVNGQSMLLHRVIAGEQLGSLAKQFQTTTEVLQALNFKLLTPLFADRVIVIAPGIKIINPNLPVFEPYQVSEQGISLDALSVRLGADLELLKLYNDCTNGCRLLKGDWLYIPRK
jgi:hypothetical protein